MARIARPERAVVVDDADEVVFELEDWSAELRGHLERRLAAERIDAAWEGDGELVVDLRDADRVEIILDELETIGPDRSAEVPEGTGQEAPYEVLSELFLAADTLVRDPGDVEAGMDLGDALERVSGFPPPFGVQPPEWDRVLALAADLRIAVDTSEDDAIQRGARALRTIVSRWV